MTFAGITSTFPLSCVDTRVDISLSFTTHTVPTKNSYPRVAHVPLSHVQVGANGGNGGSSPGRGRAICKAGGGGPGGSRCTRHGARTTSSSVCGSKPKGGQEACRAAGENPGRERPMCTAVGGGPGASKDTRRGVRTTSSSGCGKKPGRAWPRGVQSLRQAKAQVANERSAQRKAAAPAKEKARQTGRDRRRAAREAAAPAKKEEARRFTQGVNERRAERNARGVAGNSRRGVPARETVAITCNEFTVVHLNVGQLETRGAETVLGTPAATGAYCTESLVNPGEDHLSTLAHVRMDLHPSTPKSPVSLK
jgi:hypothetical protein